MEIYSLRSITNFLHKHEGRNQKEQPVSSNSSPTVRGEAFAEHVEEAASVFSAITPRQLRERAEDSYASGVIDQETYGQLASELPMQAIDQTGRVIDLSAVTDDTPFDFQDYYSNQLEIALNVGDLHSASVLRSVVTYLEG